MNQAAVGLMGGYGEVFRAVGVDGHGNVRLGFGLVDGGVGGGVDDDIGSDFTNGVENPLAIGDVELFAGKRNDFVLTGGQLLQGEAELAAGAGDEDFHGKHSASSKGRPSRSFEESMGSVVMGQSMPSCGSFQRRVRSCSGA